MPFLTPLQVEKANGQWRLIRPLIYRGKRDYFKVPTGFMTDFASVPRLLQGIRPCPGDRAAVVHDYLYREAPQVLVEPEGCKQISRRDADGVFLRIMREQSVGWLRRCVLYWGVRLGGWVAWRRIRGCPRPMGEWFDPSDRPSPK